MLDCRHMNEASLRQNLAQLGFSQNEIAVYLAISAHGKMTPGEVALKTGINRTTVYSVSKELLKRGVIQEDVSSAQRELVAGTTDSLASAVRNEQRKLNEKKELVNETMSALSEFSQDAKYHVPRIQFVTENRIEDFLHERIEVWNKSMLEHDGLFIGFQEPDFMRRFPQWLDWYWKNSPKEIRLKLLTDDTDMERDLEAKQYDRRDVYFWKDSVHFTSTTWVLGDYVVMLELSEGADYLIEIHDAVFAENQRILLKAIIEDIEEA
jgi:DNA-binding MarR family transcriptional regulator